MKPAFSNVISNEAIGLLHLESNSYTCNLHLKKLIELIQHDTRCLL